MFHRFFSLTCMVLSFLLCMVTPVWAFDTKATHAILMDYETGTVLYNHQGEEAMIPSSMTKLMTLYLTFEQLQKGALKLDDTFIVSEKAWRMEGSRTFLNVGEPVTVDHLLDGIIIQSGNDATVAMAEGIAGTEEEFVSRMNQKAKQLGLTQSHFMNCTGMPEEGHTMSALDLAHLAQHLIRDFPDYYPYFSKKEFTFNNITQQNRNLLINRNKGVDGLKTGHTEQGGYGITASAKGKNGQRLIAVVNGLPNDHERLDAADTLLAYGFNHFRPHTFFTKDQPIEQASVWGGDKKMLPLTTAEDITVTIPQETITGITAEITYNSPLPAPIKKGDQLATLTLSVPEQGNYAFPLVAAEDIQKAGYIGRAFQNIGRYIGM